ncbi:MAG: fatty-acid oxidation protein subunit alpha [Moorea sp. SIO1G6]|uniref:element excision factor XisH family protein n=1 Tax=Moorena sp. SIO1G6 TaxID=2607840 RepID=UPI0013C02815|nr:element excision factor XisH family protein [Moorena sp. SIO1G6]NET67989.1 fatty-acid oxidation protein subunit alpha [Moorena sp. SIO1G6]
MSAKDQFHDLVKDALINDGWIITHDPYRIDLGFTDLYIDLGAERLIAAERNNEKIAIEVKSFLSTSRISEFHGAIGQFINYRLALEDEEPDRTLHLAVPNNIYSVFFTYPFIQKSIKVNQVPIVVYDISQPRITQWIN